MSAEIKKATVSEYVIGLVISLVLTMTAYCIVTNELLPEPRMTHALIGLALTQAIAQLLFFLHMWREASPYSNLVLFCFMCMVLLIVLIGSLWIMENLNYNLM